MSDSEAQDLGKNYTFFDPHPGFLGAAIPIPPAIKAVADAMNGQTMTLNDALIKLRAPGIGTIRVVAQYKYVGLWLGRPGTTEHLFRVIRYR